MNPVVVIDAAHKYYARYGELKTRQGATLAEQIMAGVRVAYSAEELFTGAVVEELRTLSGESWEG